MLRQVETQLIQMRQRFERQILSRQFVNSCAIGIRERQGRSTGEPCVVAYVFPKRQTRDLCEEDTLPLTVDRFYIDVQENPPIEALSESKLPTRARVGPYHCKRFECMEEQKKELLRKNRTNKLDFLMSTPVSRQDITEAARGTRLWPILKAQMNFFETYRRPNCGVDSGFLGIRADRLPFPSASVFMRKLRRIVRQRVPHRRQENKRQLKVRKVAEPQLGMNVVMKGAASSVSRGKIAAIHASLFVDYAPWMGGDPIGEPVFSPAPAHGAYFPIDIVGIVTKTYPPRLGSEPASCPYRKMFQGVQHFRRALFVEQIVTTAMARQGDSGALLSDEQGNAIVVLFAGTKRFSYFHPVKFVEEELGILPLDEAVDSLLNAS
jgi:hypothetical protein